MINYDELDEGVRPLVRKLNQDGFTTIGSCQGGKGHEYEVPSVVFDIKGFSQTGIKSLRHKLAQWVLNQGYTGFSIAEHYAYQSDIVPWQHGCGLVLQFWTAEPEKFCETFKEKYSD